MDNRRLPSLKPEPKTRNISMNPVQGRALDALAMRAGHGNVSRIVQELVTREAIYQFGANWATRFAEDDKQEASKAA